MIAAPPVLALASLLALAAHAMLGGQAPLLARIIAASAAVLLAIVAARCGRARSIAIMCAVLSCAMLLPLPWQAAMALACAAWALLCRPIARPRRGRVPVLVTLLVAGVTPLALGAWMVVVRPDLSDVVQAYVPDLPLAVLIAGGVAFALVNATLEEVIWRGVFQDELTKITTPMIAIVVQAISFGLQHTHGVPRGLVGVLLAGTWAVMLGLLRRHADGLLAPILAHVVADASIAVIVFGEMQAGDAER